MNGYRKYMIDNGGNLSWCAPYQSEDGKIKFSLCEGKINGLQIDGAEIESDTGVMAAEYYSDYLLEKVARRMNAVYDEYSGYSNTHIIMDAAEPIHNCSDCPFFSFCEAMNNPDTWDEMPESAEYADD